MSDSGASRGSAPRGRAGSFLQPLWAASGALSVVLFACGLLFGDLLGTTNFPALDATASGVRAYFLQNASEVRVLSFFHVLSAIALVMFAAYIYGYLRRESQAPAAAIALALAGGAVAAGFLLLSALCYRTLAEPTVSRRAARARARGALLSRGRPRDRAPARPHDRRRFRDHAARAASRALDRLARHRRRPLRRSLCEHPPRPDKQPLGHLRHSPPGRRRHVCVARRHKRCPHCTNHS